MVVDERAANVRRMFGSIARRYDFLNHFLSGNIDRRWRRACLRAVSTRMNRSNPQILDIGCGTGDLALEFSTIGSVVGCDFCHPMLCIGLDKVSRRRSAHPVWIAEGDALDLPFPDCRFDAAVSAFVLRNLSDAEAGLREMWRVLRPGGAVGVLDFSMPLAPLIGRVYRYYFLKVLPRIGAVISGVNGPYSYLPQSVQTFPRPEELTALFTKSCFERVEALRLTGGIAVLLLGNKPSA